VPGAVGAARALLKQTLPSSGSEEARPQPTAQLVPGGTSSPRRTSTPGGAPSPSSAARQKSRRNTLDERFQFPDEEVTVERDLAALRRPKPIVPAGAAMDAVPSATAQTSPQPELLALAPEAPPAPPEPAVVAPARTPRPGPLHATQTRTVLSAGMAPRPPAIAHEPLDERTPIDDLDEATSVLAGDEPELDFQGSATGESSSLADEEARTPHAAEPAEPAPAEPEPAEPEPAKPAPLAEPAAPAALAVPTPAEAAAEEPSATVTTTAWTALRVAVRRSDRGEAVVEVLTAEQAAPEGTVAAIVVAQDAASADALARLLRGD
jgi:hypothetical protein